MECDICLEPMDAVERRPKMLPCGHTFCLRCLNAQERKICAVDRKRFKGPASELPDNYALLRLSEKIATPLDPRLWCRDCRKEATELCEDDHEVCSLKRIRAAEKRVEQTEPRLDALRRGQASLEDMRGLVEAAAPALGLAVADCVDGLQEDQDDEDTKWRCLQAARGEDVVAWKKAFEAAEPSALSQRAGQLLSAFADPLASCSVAVRGGGVDWSGSVDPKDAVVRLMLCRMLCAGKLDAAETPDAPGGPVEAAAGARWQERTNDLPVEEMVYRMTVGSKVARGRDWDPGNKADGTPPGRGTVLRCYNGGAEVKWDDGVVAFYRMGRENKFELRLLGTAIPAESVAILELREGGDVLDLKKSISKDVIAELNPLANGRLEEVRTVVGLHCGLSPRHCKRILQQVSPSVEVLGLDSPKRQHLEVVATMRRLRELHVSLSCATLQQLQQVLQMAKLRRLEVHCPFDAPMPLPPGTRPAAGLQWLRVGVYPLATALALVRANADTLEELELVAASTEPYGCPDLAGELRRCGPRRLRRLVLLRNSHLSFCRHDKQSCSWQKTDVKNSLEDVEIECEVVCAKCDNL